MKSESTRRQFLKFGSVTGALGLFTLSNPITKALAASCGLTPPQTSGPFYPGKSEFHLDNDLTQAKPGAPRAQGRVVYIRGQVQNNLCKPVQGAVVEIWQACSSGKYNHKNDTNPAPLDPNFKYWGETQTDEKGEYIFKTIVPGAYPADQDWTRPPHIHFKVTRLGYKDLVTQLYFKGETLNDQDLILKDVPAAQRDSVIVEFVPSPVGFEPNTLIGTFDITLNRVRNT